MAIAIVRQLNEDYLQDLCALYQIAAPNRTRRDIRRMLANSDVVLGLVDDTSDRLVGFARILTDFVYEALLLDVMIGESRQGLGLGQYLMETVLALPELRAVRDIQVQCPPDMVTFYSRWGFSPSFQGTVSMCRPHNRP